MASSYAQTITGLTAGTAYDFRVLATNAAGNGPVSSPPLVISTASGAQTSPTNTLMRSYDFINALGVNAPIPYTDGGYSNIPNVVSNMAYLGVHHIRSGISNGQGGSAPLASFETLAAAGIKFCAGTETGAVTTAIMAANVDQTAALNTASPGCVLLIEGPNEINNGPTSFNGVGPSQQGAVNMQQALYTYVHADASLPGVQVVMFTGYGFDSSYTGVGGVQGPNPFTTPGYADYDNQHPYPQQGSQPLSWVSRTATLTNETPPYGPAVYTECGYSTNFGVGQGGVDQTTQGKLLLNLIMDCMSAAITRIYIYQLMDAYNTGSPQGNDGFGLFNQPSVGNTVPKPSGTGIHNLTTILADAGGTASTFTLVTPGYSVSGLSSGGSIVIQKSTGVNEVIVWAEPVIWNSSSLTEVTASATSVTVSLGKVVPTVNIYDTMVGTSPTQTLSSVSSVTVSVVDHPIIVEVISATTYFSVSGGKVLTPTGATFVGKGVNVPDDQLSTWVTNAACQPLTSLFPGISIVRIPSYTYWAASTYDTYINRLTALGIVVVIENHQNFKANGTSGGNAGGGAQGGAVELTGSLLTTESNWYASLATHFLTNPRVWFGTNNEPSTNDPVTGSINMPGLSTWQQATYNAIRGTGNNTIIELEMANPNQQGVSGGLTPSVYAAMSGVVWGPHYYSWLWNGQTNATSESTILTSTVGSTNSQYGGIVQQIANIQTITSKNGVMPCGIYEFGPSTDGQNLDLAGMNCVNAVIAAVNQGTAFCYMAWWINFDGSPDALTTSTTQLESPYGTTVAADI